MRNRRRYVATSHPPVNDIL